MPTIRDMKSARFSSSFQEMGVSFKIILLLFMLMAGVFYGGYFVVNKLKMFENDAFIINHIGFIRGSIQRATKRELNKVVSDDLIRDIDAAFSKIKSHYSISTNSFSVEDKDIVNSILYLDALWGELKIYYSNSRMNGEYTNEMILKSEECWDQANNIAYNIQANNEKKLGRYKNEIISILALVGLFILIIIYIVYKIVHKNLEYAVITDSMTKLFNRKYFEQVINQQISISKRYNSTFSLIILDLDYFKNINDEFGHQKGDKVLILFSELLMKNIRNVDFAFRIGGEEFAIIAPHTNIKQATRLADKYRNLISEADFNLGRPLTSSLGVTDYSENSTSESIFKYADKALYQAKSEGRNTVVSISAKNKL